MATNFGFSPVTTGKRYFISYNTEDAGRIKPIVQRLNALGVPMWYDEALEPGSRLEWEEQIALQIELCDAVIMFITSGIFKKDRSFVRIEYELAEDAKKEIYWVRLDNIDSIPHRYKAWMIELKHYQAIDGTNADPHEIADRITKKMHIAFSAVESPEELYQRGENYRLGQNGFPQDYSKAFDLYSRAADAGHTGAMCNIGYMYDEGLVVKQDDAKAFEWYSKAASAGSAAAMFNLGNMYHYGQYVKQDYAKAFEWYTKAIDNGYTYAKNNLGVLYFYGRGVPQDKAKANKLYEEAANDGNEVAMYNLGVHYKNGDGLPKDLSKAKYWLQKSADAGLEEAKKELKKL